MTKGKGSSGAPKTGAKNTGAGWPAKGPSKGPSGKGRTTNPPKSK